MTSREKYNGHILKSALWLFIGYFKNRHPKNNVEFVIRRPKKGDFRFGETVIISD